MTPQGESTLSHPLWLENRVATSLGSGTGPNKICVTSQVHGLGLLAQNVLRLGALTGWGRGCISDSSLERSRHRFSRPAAECCLSESERG